MGIFVVVGLVAGHVTSTYTPERPLQDGVVYGLNADDGKAYWISWSGLDAWTGQFFGEKDSAGDCSDIWPETTASYRAPAPLAELPAPKLRQLDSTAPGVFRLHVVPAPGTYAIYVCTLPKARPVTYSYGSDTPLESNGWTAYWAPPADGYDLTVKSRAFGSLKLRVMAQTLGLPAIPGFTYTARPAWIIPDTDWWANSTWVAKTVSFSNE